MASSTLAEGNVLDTIEAKWRARGYTLIRDPQSEELPAFLRGFRPDAIAVGKSPSLAIEVIQTRGPASTQKLKQIEGLLRDRDDWRLEVVYVPPTGTAVEAVSSGTIRETLRQAGRLAGTAPKAGLLLAWAGLEAAARQREPELADRGLTSGSLIDLLASQGYVRQDQASELRQLGRVRNTLAHGQIDIVPAQADVEKIVAIGLGMLDDH